MSTSAYTASLGYEKEIAAAHDQYARNWRVDAHIQRGTDGGATVQVEAHDNGGRPMTGLKFQGRLERPTTSAPICRSISRKSASASTAAAWRRLRRGNGTWCWRATRRDSGCSSPRTAWC